MAILVLRNGCRNYTISTRLFLNYKTLKCKNNLWIWKKDFRTIPRTKWMYAYRINTSKLWSCEVCLCKVNELAKLKIDFTSCEEIKKRNEHKENLPSGHIVQKTKEISRHLSAILSYVISYKIQKIDR